MADFTPVFIFKFKQSLLYLFFLLLILFRLAFFVFVIIEFNTDFYNLNKYSSWVQEIKI
jgi:hypothetical protein